MSVLCSMDLSGEKAVEAIVRHRFPEDAIVLAFTPVEAVMGNFRPDASLVDRSEEGRVFSPEGELRWRRLGPVVRMVYLGDSMPNDPGWIDGSRHIAGLRPKYGDFLLWGVRSDLEPEWLEHQLPKRLVYPIRTAMYLRGRVKLVVENWVDASGIPRFVRYHHLEEVKGETDHAAE